MLILQKCRSFQVPSQKRSHLKRAKPGDLSLCLPFNTRVCGKVSSWEYLRPKFRGGKIFAFLSCYLSTFSGPETSQQAQPLFQGILHPFMHGPKIFFQVFFSPKPVKSQLKHRNAPSPMLERIHVYNSGLSWKLQTEI